MDDNNFMSGFYAGRDANNNDGFGGNCIGWIWILLIAAVFAGGWGGFGGFGGMGGAQGAAQNYVLSSDFATLQRQLSDGFGSEERKLDSISNGICSLGYDQLAQMNGINTNILTQANAGQMAMMQGFNGLTAQIADCCCQNRYDSLQQANTTQRLIENGFCQTGYNMSTNTTAIVQNAHNDADRILARIDRMESDRQAERIAQLTADNNALRFQISQDRQTATVVDKLGYHCPQPAYVVQPPQQVTFPTNCGGVASYATGGCGCMG